MRAYFAGNQPRIDETAFRNGTLPGGYLFLRLGPWDLIGARCPA